MRGKRSTTKPPRRCEVFTTFCISEAHLAVRLGTFGSSLNFEIYICLCKRVRVGETSKRFKILEPPHYQRKKDSESSPIFLVSTFKHNFMHVGLKNWKLLYHITYWKPTKMYWGKSLDICNTKYNMQKYGGFFIIYTSSVNSKFITHNPEKRKKTSYLYNFNC